MTPAMPALSLLALLQAGGGSSMLPFLIQIVAIFAIFYFLLIRPQQKQRRQHEEALKNIKRGDEVVTTGGIVGEIVHIKEVVVDGAPRKTMDDRITVRSGESRLVIERGRIAKVVTPTSSPATGPADRA
ncbi:MAG: preprotein translocase subunit YajC [Gemmatimonadaceae bacterium]